MHARRSDSEDRDDADLREETRPSMTRERDLALTRTQSVQIGEPCGMMMMKEKDEEEEKEKEKTRGIKARKR
jgi:hypothetical protein